MLSAMFAFHMVTIKQSSFNSFALKIVVKCIKNSGHIKILFMTVYINVTMLDWGKHLHLEALLMEVLCGSCMPSRHLTFSRLFLIFTGFIANIYLCLVI